MCISQKFGERLWKCDGGARLQRGLEDWGKLAELPSPNNAIASFPIGDNAAASLIIGNPASGTRCRCRMLDERRYGANAII